MFKSFLKTNPILKIINNSLINLPTPLNISIWWNFGSLLGMSLITQIISGLFLSIHYCANTSITFNMMIHIIQNMNFGWFFRLLHMNGASFFFLCMFMHIGRGLYYGSYNMMKPWLSGTLIFLLSMTTAFMGYVLPWGQMSFWGATVITNLISTTPYIGPNLVEWIWGDFSVSNPTLNRFFTFHFITPFMILMMVMMHLLFIHENGSNNPLGINSNLMKLPFNIYFILKDLYGFFLMFMLLIVTIMINPFLLSDPENFIPANSLITPIHIQPEWYFLFAYTILRSIPNKLGGVIALMMSILILLILPFLKLNNFQSLKFYPINQVMFWFFINLMMLLTWLGAKPIEPPFTMLSQSLTISYFSFYFINSMAMNLWNKLFF